MPWTDPFSAVPGQLMTAALWNIHVRDNLNTLKTSIANDGRINGEILAHRGAVVPLAIVGGGVAVDVSLSDIFSLALTANVTGWNISTGWVAGKGKVITIRLTQDATGGRTVVLPSTGAYRWASNAVPTITATPNKTDILVLYSDDGGATVYASMFTSNA